MQVSIYKVPSTGIYCTRREWSRQLRILYEIRGTVRRCTPRNPRAGSSSSDSWSRITAPTQLVDTITETLSTLYTVERVPPLGLWSQPRSVMLYGCLYICPNSSALGKTDQTTTSYVPSSSILHPPRSLRVESATRNRKEWDVRARVSERVFGRAAIDQKQSIVICQKDSVKAAKYWLESEVFRRSSFGKHPARVCDASLFKFLLHLSPFCRSSRSLRY